MKEAIIYLIIKFIYFIHIHKILIQLVTEEMFKVMLNVNNLKLFLSLNKVVLNYL